MLLVFTETKEDKMKKLIFLVICTVLAGCPVAPMPTPTPTVISTATPTATSTLTPSLTSTPIIGPTPIPFPPSFKDFGREIMENCAPPPKFKLKYFSDSSFQDIPSSIKLENMQLEMFEWLRSKSEKEEWDYWGISLYWDENIWYCVGVALTPSITDIISNPDMWFSNVVILIPSKKDLWENPFKNWGEWDVPVTLAYWSEDGLVVYEFQPANMPAP